METDRSESGYGGWGGGGKQKNWTVFWDNTEQDHERPDLIWNPSVRGELRQALEQQIDMFQQEREANIGEFEIGWNPYDFTVQYPSLGREKMVGPYFLRLLMYGRDDNEITAKVLNEVEVHGDPRAFFNDFFSSCILHKDDHEICCYCLHALAIVFRKHHNAPDPQKRPLCSYTGQLVSWLKGENHPSIRDDLLRCGQACTMRVEFICHFTTSMTEIAYLSDARMVDYIHTHPYCFLIPRTRILCMPPKQDACCCRQAAAGVGA